jgi:hypothetical protein
MPTTYGKKYDALVGDFSGNSYSVYLKKRNYTGNSQTINYYSTSPLFLNYRGGDKENDPTISGSEVNFNFYSQESDVDKYDEIFESEYKDWQLEVNKRFLQTNLAETLVNGEFTTNINSWNETATGTSGAWGWSSFSGGSALCYLGTFAAAVPHTSWGFFTTMEGWFNDSLSNFWAWSSEAGGCVKNTTVTTTSPSPLRFSNVVVPQQAFDVTIQYKINNSHNPFMSLSFIIKDSGANHLFNTTFTSGIDGTDQFAVLHITNSSVWTNADHFVIAANHGDGNPWVAGDQIRITDILISYIGSISFNQSHFLDQSFSLDTDKNYSLSYSVTMTGGTHNSLLGQFYNGGSAIGSRITLATGQGSFSGSVPITNNSIDKLKVWISNGVDSTQQTIYLSKLSIKPAPYMDEALFWKGWIQPDNLSRAYVAPSYFISLSATDGLADLKQIDFPFDFSLTTGQTTILYLLRKILNENGIELPISSQVNITNSHISSQTLFDHIYANPQRFVKVSDGRVKYEKAYNAITQLLDSFNAKLFQSEGKWTIVQKNEIESSRTIYDWNSFTAVTATYDRQFDNVGYVLTGTDELSKIRPVKSLELTFNNLNMGKYVWDGGFNGFFPFNMSGWDSAQFPNDFQSISWDSTNKRMETVYINHLTDNIPAYVFSNGFQCDADSGSTVTINVDINLDSVTYGGSPTNPIIPKLKIELADFNEVATDSITLDLVSGITKHFIVRLAYQETGLHSVRFYVVPQTFVTSVTTYFDNITVFLNNDDDLTRHRVFTGTVSGSSAIATQSANIYFGDSSYVYDNGALMYGASALTTTWNNYGGGISLPLQKLAIYNKLRQFKRFKNYLRLSVKADSIHYDNILSVKGKLYNITGYAFDIKNNNLQLELSEYLDEATTVTFEELSLNGAGTDD